MTDVSVTTRERGSTAERKHAHRDVCLDGAVEPETNRKLLHSAVPARILVEETGCGIGPREATAGEPRDWIAAP